MLDIEATKACFKCGETKQLSMFYICKTNRDGHRNKCKACNRETDILNTKRNQAYKDKWITDNPSKRYAQNSVNNALRDGRLFKPSSCVKCGKTGCKIYGHHWSYLPEHYLDVLWVCSSCHGKEHRKS